MAPPLVGFALDYYRTPLAYGHVADMSRPLPKGFSDMLADFGTALSAQNIDETAQQLSTNTDELREAARFFARHALLGPAADHYRCLGLARDASEATIRGNYKLLIRMFHPDRVSHANDADLAYSSRLNAAYRVLRDPATRARYDKELPKPTAKPIGARELFRPHATPSQIDRRARWTRVGAAMRKPRLALVIVGGLSLLAIYLFTMPRKEPALRLTGPGLAAEQQVLPRYLAASEGDDARHDGIEIPASAAPQAGALVANRDTIPASRADSDRAAQAAQDHTSTLALQPSVSEVHPVPAGIATPVPAQRQSAFAPAVRIEAKAPLSSKDLITAHEPQDAPPAKAVDAPPADARGRTIESEGAALEAIAQTPSAQAAEARLAQATRPAVSAQQQSAPARADTAAKADAIAAESTKTVASLSREPEIPVPRRIEPTPARDMTTREEPAAAELQITQVQRAQADVAPQDDVEAASRSSGPRTGRMASLELNKARTDENAAQPNPVPEPPPRPAPPVRETLQPAMIGTRVLARFEAAYESGNASALAALFSADARTSDGNGKALIRRQYARLFRDSLAQRLSVKQIRWRPNGAEHVRGSGQVRVSVKDRATGAWRVMNGRIELELERSGERYKIATLLYDVK